MSYDDAVLVGVMSGTSLDGVTAAVARFTKRQTGFTVQLLGVETVPYADALRERIASASRAATAAEYSALAFHLGERFADAAAQVLATAGVARADIAAIASHGHTMWHAPPAGTWQLGEGAVIAERVGIPVIEDFRVRDVAAGGQGAPLVTIADALLFGSDAAPRALQNIGGMANVTVVPRLGDMAGVRAFDTGPGVAIIDALTQMFVEERFDRNGEYARVGKPVESVLEHLLKDEYFRREPPKSTGRETFGHAFAIALLDACRAADPECSDPDVLATATELTARSIALAYERFVPEPIADILVSGGGAQNTFLIERLKSHVSRHTSASVVAFQDVFFPGDAKEAVAFAFLGFLHLRGEAGNVATATGARGPRVLGKRIPA
jgi:anhydro-N-acetylmuramic acid kinase